MRSMRLMIMRMHLEEVIIRQLLSGLHYMMNDNNNNANDDRPKRKRVPTKSFIQESHNNNNSNDNSKKKKAKTLNGKRKHLDKVDKEVDLPSYDIELYWDKEDQWWRNDRKTMIHSITYNGDRSGTCIASWGVRRFVKCPWR